MALSYISRAWALARNVEDLLGLQKEVRQSLQVIEQRLRALEDRMLKLETEQGRVFTEARNAATVMASGIISEAVTRITRLEGRTEQIEHEQQRRLPS